MRHRISAQARCQVRASIGINSFVAKRRMLILVKVAPPPPPPPEVDDAEDADAPKSERKTGFFGVAPQNGSPGGSGKSPMLPLGRAKDVILALRACNVGPDGSGPQGWGETPGMATLYGPGCIIELPTSDDGREELAQAMVTVTDEDFAWPVLSRICRTNQWKMMHPESGRMFG